MRWVLCWLALLGMALPKAEAWSNKEHIQLTRIAAERLMADPTTPADMRQWLARAAGPLLDAAGERDYLLHNRVGSFPRGVDGILFWCTVPDMHAIADKPESKVDPFGVHEGKLHYIDLELFMSDPAQRTYADDLSHQPKPSDIPRNMADPRFKTAGMLPFTIDHAYGQLVKAIRDGRLDDAPGKYPRDEHAARWAGYLAHYLQDNTQPHHATEDYKSRSYFPGIDSKQAPDIHADMEYRLVDDDRNDYADLRLALWDSFSEELRQFKDPVRTKNLWQATLEVSLISYDALPIIGRAAKIAYPQAGPDGPGPWNAEAFFQYTGQWRGEKVTVLKLKAKQWAWAVVRVEEVWRRAWEEARARGR